MDATDLAFAGAARQAELVAAGEVTPRELVELCLERIARLDPRLNAFRVVFAERARAEADALGAPGPERPLHGVPVAVKDDQDVEGEPTPHGTAVVRPPAREDSEVVRRLRAAGAIVIGKTNVPELTIWGFTESAGWGVTRNPWHLDRIPGGSSGGSAAAVAAGLVPLATGSDGLGSIRIPAAMCGLVGLKPQKGRVSLAPRHDGWFGLNHFGVLTRSVRDTALALDAIADRAFAEPLADTVARGPGRLRVALSFRVPPPTVTRVTGEVRGAVQRVAEVLRGLGHEVVDRHPPYEVGPFARGTTRWLRGIDVDARATGQPERLERRTQGMARLGRRSPQAWLARSLREEAAYAARLSGVFAGADVLLTPMSTAPPHEIGRFEGRGVLATVDGESRFVPFTGTWNITGHPALALPAGMSGEGTPIGAQLVGRPEDEATLLALAAQLEAELRWTDRRPPTS